VDIKFTYSEAQALEQQTERCEQHFDVFVPFGHEFIKSLAVQIGLVHAKPLTSSPLTSTLVSWFSSINGSRRVDIPTFPVETTAITRVPDVGCVRFHCSAERSYLATGHLLGPLKQLLGNR
jgi:hypothetical protein